LYSAHKLQCSDQQRLDSVLSDTSFSCGTALQDYITDEISDDHILRRVFVQKNISCSSRIEPLTTLVTVLEMFVFIVEVVKILSKLLGIIHVVSHANVIPAR